MEVRSQIEQHVEVHKFIAGAVIGVVLLALVFEAFLLGHFRRANMIELPLLVTIYFALSRRSASGGLLLGMVVGIAQDSLGHTPIGLYGIAKTVVGFVASSLGSRIDVEHPTSRFILTFLFFHLHNAVLVFISRILLGQHAAYINVGLIVASLVNSGLALLLFPLLDRLRRPS